MKKIMLFGAVLLTLVLTGCESDSRCLFADDWVGCLVVADNQNRE